jgi:hypothetical protein
MGYRTLEEWEVDLEKFRQNPNDLRFLDSIVRKVNSTEKVLQSRIESSLKEAIIWSDPIMSYQEMIKDLDDTAISKCIIRNETDPWFET